MTPTIRIALTALVLFACAAGASASSHWQWVNPLPTPNFVLGATWGNNEFVAVDDAGMINRSPDGITWTAQFSGSRYTLEDGSEGGRSRR